MSVRICGTMLISTLCNIKYILLNVVGLAVRYADPHLANTFKHNRHRKLMNVSRKN